MTRAYKSDPMVKVYALTYWINEVRFRRYFASEKAREIYDFVLKQNNIEAVSRTVRMKRSRAAGVLT